MSKLHLLGIAAVMGVTGLAQAGGPGRPNHGASYQDWARVTHVQPQYQRVNVPRQQCTVDYVYDHGGANYIGDRSAGGVLIGGVAGGIIGNQVGKGNGKVAATAAGAVVGALVGDQLSRGNYQTAHRPPQRRPVERCYPVDHWEDRLTGYDVTYEYNGRRYTRFMTERPGNRVRVSVSVSPV